MLELRQTSITAHLSPLRWVGRQYLLSLRGTWSTRSLCQGGMEGAPQSAGRRRVHFMTPLGFEGRGLCSPRVVTMQPSWRVARVSHVSLLSSCGVGSGRARYVSKARARGGKKQVLSRQKSRQFDDVMVISFPGQRCGPRRRLGNS